jgi:hypothetical protein
MRALMEGRIGESVLRCDEAESLGRMAHSRNATMLVLTQRWVRLRVEGQHAMAAQLLSEGAGEAFGGLPGTSVLRAICLVHSGQIAEARASFAAVVEGLAGQVRDAEWLPTMAQAAEVASALDDRDAAALLDELMAPFDDRVVVEGIGAAVYGTLGGFRARLVGLLGRTAEAERLERQAMAAAEGMGLRRVPKLAVPGGRTEPHRAVGDGSFRREGEVWALTFLGATARVRHSKGLQDLAVLLRNAGSSVHVTELVGAAAVTASRGEPILDRRAAAQYRQRLADLDEDLAEAEARHDTGRTARLRDERAFLLAELGAGFGLGGRARRSGDDVDRARKAVQARVREAIARIGEVHAPLGRHLGVSVRTGTFCSYEPAEAMHWTVS